MDKPQVKIKNSKLIASENELNEAVEEVMGFVSRATPTMIG